MIAPKHHSSSSNSRSSTPRKWLLAALVIFGLGTFIGFSYGQAGAVVSHAVDQIVWTAIAGPASPGASAMVTAINNASASAPNKTTGINADALDGLDSSFFTGGGGGGVSSSYSTYCSWMTTESAGSTSPTPLELFHPNCQDTSGVDLTGPAANPPACAPGWTSTAINWYPVGISQWSPHPVLQHGISGVCVGTCSDNLIFEYPNAATSGVSPVIVNVIGVGERICTQ